MHQYENLLRDVLQLAGDLYFRRVESELWVFATALGRWLHDLPKHPKSEWRERLDDFIAQQEIAGIIVAPESRRALLAHLDVDEESTDAYAPALIEVEAPTRDRRAALLSAAPKTESKGAQPRRPVGRFKSPPNRRIARSEGEAFFYRKLARARQHVAEIERILQAFSQKLDAAKEDEAIEVESELEAIDSLIFQYNDALESAIDVWLRDDLKGNTFDALSRMSSHWGFGLPQFTDKVQAQRAAEQAKRIGERLDERTAMLDRIIFWMKVIEHTGTAASLAVGGIVLWTAVREGGKLVIVKTAAKVAASGAASYAAGQAIEHGLRAAGVSEETIDAVQHAGEVVTWLLLLRGVRVTPKVSRSALPKATASKPHAGSAPAPGKGGSSARPPRRIKQKPRVQTGDRKKRSNGKVRPGSVSDKPENRLVETGIPLKGRIGWQKRWTRMTREDELRQAEAIEKRYNEVLREAEEMPDSVRRNYVFEQMRRFRTEYRKRFLEERTY